MAMASSGIASLLLHDGSTAHSMLKIPFKANNTSVCNITPNSQLAKKIRETSLFIWDEAPLMNKDVFECVDRTFRDIMKMVSPHLENTPFGGKIFVFGGDFRQLLPVIPRANRATIVSMCINRAKFWKYVKKLKLKINMRAHVSVGQNSLDQKEWSEFLLKIGDGKEKIVKGTDNMIELPEDMCIDSDDIEKIIDYVYDDIESNYMKSSYLINRAILNSTNKMTDLINETVLNRIPNDDIITLLSTDTPANDSHSSLYPTEFLNSCNTGGLPSHKLMLKKNAIILLLRNLNINEGLCNGTRLIVRNIKKHVIEAEIVTGKNIGTYVFLPRITLTPDEDDVVLKFNRKQFPVKLAFGLTINRCQGQTIEKAGLCLNSNLFTHGHLYTALSRVPKRNSIKILIQKSTINNKMAYFVNNVVYEEVFRFI